MSYILINDLDLELNKSSKDYFLLLRPSNFTRHTKLWKKYNTVVSLIYNKKKLYSCKCHSEKKLTLQSLFDDYFDFYQKYKNSSYKTFFLFILKIIK